MTADLGIGANMAIESAVVLCNVLQRSLASNPNPTASEITAIFSEYQSKRYERAKVFMELSGSVTRMRSYQSLWKRFFITHIATLPFMQRLQGDKFIEGFAKGPKLDYAATRTINEDAEGWKLPEEKKNDKESKAPWVMYALVASAVGVGLSYAAVLKWGLPL
jgi:FAD dependent monooxygenase